MNIKRVAARSLLGALPGMAVAGYGTYELGKSAPAYEKMKGNLVDAKSTVKKHAPDVIVATAKKDLKQIAKNEREEKFLQNLLDYVKKQKNAVYISGRNAIVSPPKVNKSLIGHEIGHSIDISKRGQTPVDAFFQTRTEEGGWKESPFQDPESKALSKLMLHSYRGGDKIKAGGILTGAGITASLALPSILKMLKK